MAREEASHWLRPVLALAGLLHGNQVAAGLLIPQNRDAQAGE